MINLKEFRSQALAFPDLLNYALSPIDGVVQLKSGGLMASFRYRGKDMGSCTVDELNQLSVRLNDWLVCLGGGWMLHVDAIRKSSEGYPVEGAFPDKTSFIIDEERRFQFNAEGHHFETDYVLSLTYHPPAKIHYQIVDWIYERKSSNEGILDRILHQFKNQIEDFEGLLKSFFHVEQLKSYRKKDTDGTWVVFNSQLEYLKNTITGQKHSLRLPSIPMYLDVLLGGVEVIGGNEIKVGEDFVKLISIDGFPQDAFAGILREMDTLGFEYRWSTRFIFYEAYRAKPLLEKYRDKWKQKVKPFLDQLMNKPSGNINEDANKMAIDASTAVSENESGLVKYGHYTSVIVIRHKDPVLLQEEARHLVKIFMNLGFHARIEGVNSMEAFLGSLPGHHAQNVRRPLLHTLNLSHLLPLTSIWAGLEYNPNPMYPEKSPALCHGKTTGFTPFRLNLHVGDLGHTLLLGRSGGGKSTMISFLIAQFLRYENAQVFAFDKGYSAYVLAKASGADHIDVGGDSGVLSFCPLQDIETVHDRTWALGWIESLLTYQGLPVTPSITNTLHEALLRLSASKSRSLTEYCALVQDTDLRAALKPYTLEGPMGELLDAKEDNLKKSRFQVFELSHLLALNEKYYGPVLLYLFHQIEKRFDGSPTFVPIDEGWLALMIEAFRDRVVQWLRELRKKNVMLLLATQRIMDAINSPLKDILLNGCPTQILLPDNKALTQQMVPVYESIGLNIREIEMLSYATEKRDYYYVSELGRRMFSLGLGEVALSFVGCSDESSRGQVRALINDYGDNWPARWLEERGLFSWSHKWVEA